MQRSLSTIFALGILGAIFMVVMSAFYLRQMPTQADLDAVDPLIRRQHGIYLSSNAPLQLSLLVSKDKSEEAGEGIGVRVQCILRPDIRRHKSSVSLHLRRIAHTVLESPQLKGRIQFVRCEHVIEPVLERVVTLAPPRKPAQQALSGR